MKLEESLETNTKVVLAKRPEKVATSDCFEVISEALSPLAEGEVRVQVAYISVDAGTRTMLVGDGFHQQVGLGRTILAGGVGFVLESRAEGFEPGQAVRGALGAQTIATVSAKLIETVEPLPGHDLSIHLGALGASTGITAWIGVKCVAKPKDGDVFVVSAAAGAVGSIAGQIAKKQGARVIGIAGGERKKAFLTETLGFDAGIDYKAEDVTDQLKALAPEGVNVFFDNVGGSVMDAVLDVIAMRSKVVICGAISQYNQMDQVVGPSMYLRLAERQSIMEGFAYFHFPESIPAAKAELADWVSRGELVIAEEILEGIERYPEALGFMFEGGNLGKLMVRAQ